MDDGKAGEIRFAGLLLQRQTGMDDCPRLAWVVPTLRFESKTPPPPPPPSLRRLHWAGVRA